MDRSTHRKILAEIFNCQERELLSQYERMTAQIRNDAIVTLSMEKAGRKVNADTYVTA